MARFDQLAGTGTGSVHPELDLLGVYPHHDRVHRGIHPQMDQLRRWHTGHRGAAVIRSADPWHEEYVYFPLMLKNQVHHGS
jgi:hypothetical protein